MIIPIRTVSEANQRCHWSERAKRAKSQRQAAYLLTRTSKDFTLGVKPSSITLTRLAPRKLDSDNLAGALKAVRDGVADALGINDGDEAIAWAYAQRTSKTYGVEVEVR